MNVDNSLKIQKRFRDVIPGGCHTYAKGDDQYPQDIPVYIARGKGSHVWDIDGNEYIEYGIGLRTVTLGHAFGPVVEAAHRQMLLGNNYVRPAKIELDCAEEFLSIIDGADMVKFCKDGSDATTGAVKLARAYTGRDMVAICGDQPFFSVDDWFIGSTPMSAGIPESTRELTVKFHFNDIESEKELFGRYPGKIACVFLEAEKYDPPVDNFLHELQRIAHENGAVFILDEMITGFRWHLGGAQKKYDIVPDLSAFGKALGNGFAISALAGKRDIMELGGLDHAKERVFLMSTTHGAENHALAAALATMRYHKINPVIETLYEQGRKLAEGVNRASGALGLLDHVSIIGPDCCSVYTTRDQDKKPSQPFRTLFLQETMKLGLLMPSSIVSYSHSDKDIEQTVERISEALVVYKKALDEGIEKYLLGDPVKPVFRKYNF
ncbi:MAG: glutamate-1-semialdehyde 2,1-aminomutase [Candidatus Aminicenantes bacterium RBG_19FT_COMBO_58_17]|nr:MAG: glutamate-1-semialdehyde 2,1-aminomutase [Candidatus Aminicenantes bacterium RBG_19FT_COMBO_58_17]